MYKNTPRTYFMGGATPTDMAMINRGVFFMGGADTSTKDWKNKPADWSDIRKDCPENSIALYAGELGSNYIIKDGKLTWANPNLYLKGDGNSCILTDYAPSYKTTVDIKVGDVNNWIMGSRQTSGTIDFGIAYYLATFGKNVLQFTNILSGTYTFNYGQTLIKDGVTIGTFPDTTSVNTVPFLLFGARTEENTNIALSSGKIYYCKIYDDGVLVNHFVPVPQGLEIGNFTCPSNGMLDIVNQQFYGNSGTGSFTYGKDSVANDYDNLGFTAACTGGYNVFIDGTQYGTTYASDATCSITWSTSGITTGDDITTPSAMKAHKIWIEPATEGNDITAFHCARVAESGQEQQGVLWAHFNLSNRINLGSCLNNESNYYKNLLTEAVTAKNNLLNISALYYAFANSPIKYFPVIVGEDNNNLYNLYSTFKGVFADKITLKDMSNTYSTSPSFSLFENSKVKKILGNYICKPSAEMFKNCQYLEQLPENIDFSGTLNLANFLTNAVSLKDTVLDTRAGTGIVKIGCYGNSTYFMTGFKGLRVSNEAPFYNATPPQINVSYTGMDRAALVQLFNDLPTVTDGQIINITGTYGSSSLTDEELAIAENKGWTVVGGPAFQVYATYSGASVGDTIKLNDGMATSAQVWSAFPSDTALTGDYTQTKTVTAVDGDLLECEKPTQDNKIVDINTGLVYYAYTNENDNTDSVYATDNPISESPNPSTLYNSSFQELNPQPEFNVSQQGLINATEYGSLTNNNGIYSGFNSSNFIYLNTTTPQTSMDFIIKCNPSTGYGDLLRTQPDGKGILLRCSGSSVVCYLSSSGSGWNTLSGFNTGISMSASTDIYVRITWNSSNGVYTFWQSSDGQNWTERNSSSSGLASPYWNGGNQTIGACSSYSEHWYGSVDMKETKLIIDGNTINFYNINSAIIIDNVNYIRNSANDLVQEILSDIEIVDNTTINNITITSDQTATIETSTNITSSNNNMAITDGSYYLFNITTPPSLNTYLQANGANLTSSEMPLLIKKDSGIGLLLKNGNTAYYRKSFIIDRNYDLHYQQINFSYPSGAIVSCKINNVLQNDLTPYVYASDIVSWTCDNAGTITSGTFTVPYSSLDGNIQTITIS